MAAPTIEWVRPGVGFTPDAAASFRRAEASWGRQIDCNSSYRDYGLQLSMWRAWTAWTEGRGPKPNHSRALHPDKSAHTQGLGLDSDDWTVPGFIAHMAEHGWIRTAPEDPTERHHFEYQSWRDQHYGEPAALDAAPIPEEEDLMNTYVFVPLVGGLGTQVVSTITGNWMHVQNAYHETLLRRVRQNDGQDGMAAGELEIVRGYLSGINPPPNATVDTQALADALADITDTQDAAIVRQAVDEALTAHTKRIAAALGS